MLVLCAVFARRLWRCTACRGEWREAREAPRVARTAPENALDEPAGAARAPCRLAHRLHAAVNSLVDGGQSHDCRSKPAGFVTPFTQSFFGFAFLFCTTLRRAADVLQNKLTRAQYLDEVTWTTKSWLGLQKQRISCLLYTSPSPRDATLSRMPSSA